MTQSTSEADRTAAVMAALAIPPDERDRAQAARKRAEFNPYEREHYDALVAALGEGFDVDALSGQAQHVLVWLARSSDDWTIGGVAELLRTARLLEGVHAVREQATAPPRHRDDPLDGQLSIDDAVRTIKLATCEHGHALCSICNAPEEADVLGGLLAAGKLPEAFGVDDEATAGGAS